MLQAHDIAPETVRPIRRGEYVRLVDMGAFDDERVELLRGAIVRMSPHGPAHDAPVDRLTELLVQAVGTRAKVRVQSAFGAADSQPEPDLCVVPRRDYDQAHPTEAYLVIEVADSSLHKDRGVKAELYAECGIPEYWIVNVADRQIEVRTEPTSTGYGSLQVFRQGERIHAQWGGVVINVDDVLLPPR